METHKFDRRFFETIDSETKAYWLGFFYADGNVWEVADALASLKHYNLVPKGYWRYIRPVDPLQLKAGAITEWPEPNEH
jgi:hypothetical protein